MTRTNSVFIRVYLWPSIALWSFDEISATGYLRHQMAARSQLTDAIAFDRRTLAWESH